MKPIHRLAILAVLCGATSSWSLADEAKKDSAAAAKTAETADKSAPNDRKAEMVCTSERITGSRLARRVCHSREELEMMQRAGRETVEKIQQMPLPLKSD